MISQITRDEALNLLKTYNKEPFHILHGLTVEGVMRWYAKELGYGNEEDFWGIDEKIIHATASHGYAWMDTGRSDSENN